MDVNVKLEWKGAMSFDAAIDGHTLRIDADSKVGGNDTGPRPKKLLLVALGGCTGMDIVSLLKKMRVDVEQFSIGVDSFQTEDEHPFVYDRYKITFFFEGKELENQQEKIVKAVKLSQEKYCGVSAMLSKSAPVTYEIRVNGQIIEH